jgi:hypothetical protein
MITEAKRVAWPAVVVLAVLLAFVDGFWAVSLRGAVGSIRNTQHPFAAWIHDSLLAVPLLVFAVLAAVVLAARMASRRPDRTRAHPTLRAWLLIGSIATLPGAVLLASQGWSDYTLQAAGLGMSGSMSGVCFGGCLERMQQAAAGVQLQALGTGVALLLASNLLAVGWVAAVCGGRLPLTARDGTASSPRRRGAVDPGRLVLAAALVGSAAIHLAVVPEHLDEWRAAGVFFFELALAQLVLAVCVAASAKRWPLYAAGAISVLPLAVWAASRSGGLPFGPAPGVPEAVGTADLAATVLEAAAVAIAVGRIAYLSQSRPALPSQSRPALPSDGPCRHAARLLPLALGICLIASGTAMGLGAVWTPSDTSAGTASNHAAAVVHPGAATAAVPRPAASPGTGGLNTVP